MKRIFTLILALSLLALTACSGGGTGETDSLTPEERTQRFVTAITDARSEEDNEYNSILSSADDDTADMTFQLLGVTAEDMTAYALSVSPMNIRAYAVAAIFPAAGKEEVLGKAKAAPEIAPLLEGKQLVKEIYVPGKLVNIVAKG